MIKELKHDYTFTDYSEWQASCFYFAWPVVPNFSFYFLCKQMTDGARQSVISLQNGLFRVERKVIRTTARLT